ncbi:MAG: galactose-1-phosphate uridylyltransferase [Actinomycetota bacterium]|nr:galactose-1-phosphate uridylyltransferase [Actinomycetota bacterium]
MPELRQDPVTKNWVVIAKERAKRPDDFIRKRSVAEPHVCPFDYGNESMTPPEVLAFRPENTLPNSPGWSVRVVPNKFPAFTPENGSETTMNNFYRLRKAYGAHEVVIHGPEHNLSLATYPNEQVAEVLRAYILRLRHHEEQPYGNYVQILINHGKEAGASLEHSHSQIFVTPIIPEVVRNELVGSASYYNENRRCVFCDMIEQERIISERLIDRTENYIVFSPFAAKLPFETWILPMHHQARFELLTDDNRYKLASIFKKTLQRFYIGLNDPPYNMYLHTSPRGYDKPESYHWHISIIPKLTIAAGFELSTGMWINITSPESSAAFLRNALD